MIFVKNLAMLLIVFGILMIVFSNTETFTQNMAAASSVGEGGVCTGNVMLPPFLGSNECAGNMKCVDSAGNLVLPTVNGNCRTCTNSNVGLGVACQM